MRGSVAFQAALGLLWTSSPALVGAAAIEPVTVSIPSEHVHVATAVAREEGEFAVPTGGSRAWLANDARSVQPLSMPSSPKKMRPPGPL